MIKLLSLLLEGMSPAEAEYIFSRYGVPNASSLSSSELKSAWAGLAKAHHPDKGGKDINMRYINAAYDVLKQHTRPAGSTTFRSWSDDEAESRRQRAQYDREQQNRQRNYDQQFHREQPKSSPWAWAGWSGGAAPMDDYGDSPQNINYIKKQAWEMSGHPTPSKQNEYTFWNWDGKYFRGVVTVYAKKDENILFKISELVVKWDTPHKSVAVFFFNGSEPRRLFLINVRGKKADPVEEFEHNSFNNNPGNDNEFVNYLRKGQSINL